MIGMNIRLVRKQRSITQLIDDKSAPPDFRLPKLPNYDGKMDLLDHVNIFIGMM